MRLLVNHKTTYRYSQPVFLEPHHLYLYPAYRPYISLKSYNIEISPNPAGHALRLDAENNNFHQVWFSDSINEINIHTSFEVDLSNVNPFDLIIEEEDASTRRLLNIYLEQREKLPQEIINWIKEIESVASGNTISFLATLTQQMHERWRHIVRLEEGILPAIETFSHSSASCRDLSWLMIQMLRSIGYPCRFVSGYAFNPELDGHDLHAWVEVWVHGAGWIGLDPSIGLLTTEIYIPLAASHSPELTLPVIGKYRGSATSTLTSNVSLKQL